MKFSFVFIKKLVPAVKSKKDLVEKLNLHSFEAVDAGGSVIDVSIPPNRYSDAASHFGIAREISAVLGGKFKLPQAALKSGNSRDGDGGFNVEIRDKKLCSRYTGQYFENVKIKPSPEWLRKILIDCGLKPINNVVDIMNYVMLETGQPLHAFDYDKIMFENLKPEIIVRRAKKGEKITTLDDKTYELDENILVIAGEDSPRKSASSRRESAILAIAGIKGGKRAEVGKDTRRIIVEAANFDGINIYKSSKKLNLSTDASSRFSHQLSSELVALGIKRAAELLETIVGAETGTLIDVYEKKPPKKIIKFDIGQFNRFIGADLSLADCRDFLERLGFKIVKGPKLKNENSFYIEPPLFRIDIETFEDVAEEVARLYGYNRLKSSPPKIHLVPSGFEDEIVFKDKIRKALVGMGFSEVYNYSFASKGEIEVLNPVAEDKKYLRPSLTPLLVKNADDNFRFFDDVKIFEIGKVFTQVKIDYTRTKTEKIPHEAASLGIAFASKKKETFFELKGIIGELFKKIGLVDYIFVPAAENVLKIESNGEIIGNLKKEKEVSAAEIDFSKLLKLVVGEHEYRPLPKYPSAMRDISISVPAGVLAGDLMRAIQETDAERIEDVDLIDEYGDSLTFRIVFQSPNRTLTNEEISETMEKIAAGLKKKFKAKIR